MRKNQKLPGPPPLPKPDPPKAAESGTTESPTRPGLRSPEVLGVAWEQGRECYRMYYLRLPRAVVEKYAVKIEEDDSGLVAAKTERHFLVEVVGI